MLKEKFLCVFICLCYCLHALHRCFVSLAVQGQSSDRSRRDNPRHGCRGTIQDGKSTALSILLVPRGVKNRESTSREGRHGMSCCYKVQVSMNGSQILKRVSWVALSSRVVLMADLLEMGSRCPQLLCFPLLVSLVLNQLRLHSFFQLQLLLSYHPFPSFSCLSLLSRSQSHRQSLRLSTLRTIDGL